MSINTENKKISTVDEFIEENFNERERGELRLATFYYQDLQHGTDGHHRLMLIAKLFYMLLSELAVDDNNDVGGENEEIIKDSDLCRTSVLSA